MHYEKVPVDSLGRSQDDLVATTKELEKYTDVDIQINKQVGTVEISGENEVTERLFAEAVRALRVGFTERDARTLLTDDRIQLMVVDLRTHTATRKEMRRQKGRIIGKNGRTRELLEELTGATVSISENVIGVIGTYEQITTVRRAVGMFLDGDSHRTVYRFLEQTETRNRYA